MKLWVEDNDNRPPPEDDWTWVKTYKDAIAQLTTGQVDCISLDHDLADFGPERDYTGYDICLWMAENNSFPKEVRVHSANPVGKQNMIAVIERYAPKGTLTDTMPAMVKG